MKWFKHCFLPLTPLTSTDCHWFHGLRQTHLQGDFAKHLAIDLREALLWPLLQFSSLPRPVSSRQFRFYCSASESSKGVSGLKRTRAFNRNRMGWNSPVGFGWIANWGWNYGKYQLKLDACLSVIFIGLLLLLVRRISIRGWCSFDGLRLRLKACIGLGQGNRHRRVWAGPGQRQNKR